MTSTSAEVVVLGAGPAGLGAALRLARAGRSVVVLERAPVVGGLAASFEVAGVRVDHGSHRLHPAAAPAVRAELDALLGDELQTRPRNGRVRLAGRWVAFPPRPADLLRRVPVPLAARLALDAAFAPVRRARSDTFAEVVRAGLGPTMLREFYAPYVEKIWAVPPDELAGELARRRVGASSPSAVLRKVVLRLPRAGGNGTFLYPRRGFGRIVERLAEAGAAAGAEIRTSAEFQELRLDDCGATVVVGDGTAVDAGHVLSTVPMPALAGLGRAPTPVLRAARALEFRALALVYLAVDRPTWTPYDAHYVPSPDAAFSRISEPKRYRDAPEDPTDRTVLCAEVPCSVGDSIWSSDDRALGELVADGLGAVGLPPVEPVEVVVRRVPNAYPVYRVGFERGLAEIDDWVSAQPRLLTFGRQGLFAHDNTHHALVMGFAAADLIDTRAIESGAIDSARWLAARRAFAAHVVED